MKRRWLHFGYAVVAVLALSALAGPLLAPDNPATIHLEASYAAPGGGHWLGADHLGRDMLSRLVFGGRISLGIAVCVALISLLVGVPLGMLSAWYGGKTDLLLMRVVDILQAFPGLILALALAAFLGPGVPQLIFALSATGWIGLARITRGQVLVLRERDYVQAARALGQRDRAILARHLLPNLMAPVLVQLSFLLAAVILAESGLSFLGLGIPDAPSWGAMLKEGSREMQLAPWMAIWPGAAIMAAVLAFNLIGDGLRDRWDVRGE